MFGSARIWLLLFALIGGLLVAAACGGSDDDDGDDNGEPTAEATTDDGSGPTAVDGDDGDVQSALDSISDEFQNREAKITYEITSSTEGVAGTYTLFWKPPDRWRFDITSEDGGISLIHTPDATYTCTGAGGEGQCLDAGATGTSAIPVPFLSSLVDETGGFGSFLGAAFAGVDVDESSETIAGIDATCYRVSGSAEGETGFAEVCEGDGIVLRWQGGTEGDSAKIEATAVEDTVADGDLEPIYPITDLGDFQP